MRRSADKREFSDEVLREAMKEWVEDNRLLIEEKGYVNMPEAYELDEGGFLHNASSNLKIPDIEVARSEFIRHNKSIADDLDLIILPKKEYERMERENRRLKAENEELKVENTHLRGRVKWLEEQVKELPTRKYRVLKQYGVLREGQIIEVFNIPWAEELIKQGILEPVDREDGIRVEQYCPSASMVVVLKVESGVYGSTVKGVVKACSAGKCKEAGFCWLNRKVYTAIS